MASAICPNCKIVLVEASSASFAGTHLVNGGGTVNGGARGWTETVWNGAGSGCSAYNTALTGQPSFGTGCAKRAVADVSAVADSATAVAVYDSTSYQGRRAG